MIRCCSSRSAPVPGVLFGLTVAAELVAAALAWGLQSPLEAALSGLYAVYAVVLAGAGALIAARHPRNAIGWLFVGFALLNALASDLAFAWSMRAAVEGWSGAAVAGWISATSWLPSGFGWTADVSALSRRLGLALGQGSAVATAAATLVVAVGFHPVRVRVQDVVDRRFNRARYHALRRMADFLEDLRAGFVLPEQIEPLLAELLKDPELQLFVFLPQSQMYVDLAGSPVDDRPDDDRSRVAVQAGGAPLAVVVHERRRMTRLRHADARGAVAIDELRELAGTPPAARRAVDGGLQEPPIPSGRPRRDLRLASDPGLGTTVTAELPCGS